MGTVRRSVLSAAASVALTGAAVFAAGPGLPSEPLFNANFDVSSGQITATLGAINAYFTPLAVKLTADSVGGNKLAIDDSFTVSGLPTAVGCWFKDNKTVESGVFEFAYEITVSSSHLPFQTGIVIDAPQSDMVPATGPDENGFLLIGGAATTTMMPAGTELIVHGTYSRASKGEDWLYDITVEDRKPVPGSDPVLVNGTGRATGTAGHGIVGLAFRKLTGSSGVATMDDIQASYSQPPQASKKR